MRRIMNNKPTAEHVPAKSRDTGNTPIDELTAPLAPDDNVFTLVHPDQGDIETMTVPGAHPR